MAFPGSVTADAETQNAVGAGDVADDAAFLIHPSDPTQSVIVTTNKSFGAGEGGLYVYTLAGSLVETEATTSSTNSYNNVDIRYNFGGIDNVIGATNREALSIDFYTYDFADTADELRSIGSIPTNFTAPNTEPYGFAMGRLLSGGVEKFYCFASSNNGQEVKQWELTATGGVISGTHVRTIPVPSIVEGIVVDDENGKVYIGVEDVEIRKYDTNPSSTSFTTVDTVSGGNLADDIEGLAIYHGSTATTGYLIASSQGDNKYCVYERGGSNAFLGKFDIVAGSVIDGTNSTDGLDVTNINMGGAFSQGALVVHDALNTPTTESNFKIVGFSKIATLGGLTGTSTYSPRLSLVNAPTSPVDPTNRTKYINLLGVNAAAWTTGGPGTVTIASITGEIKIVADGTGLVYARRGVPTTVNKRYQLTWSCDTTTVMARQVGSTAGASDIIAAANSTVGDNKREFTATSTTTWVQFQRTAAGSPLVSNLILQEIPDVPSTARRLNGKSQHFSLDVQNSALRMSNANWYIGGFMALTYLPDSPFYIMDFGRTDPTGPGGGSGRVRLFYDPSQDKVAGSTVQVNDANYRENYIIQALEADTWYYVGLTAKANADILVNVGTVRGSSYIGTVIPPVSASDICRFLQIGARTISPRTNFAPCRFSNWIWASNWIPTDGQINLLAEGKPPNEVAGLTAPAGGQLFHWPMIVESGNEPSIGDTGPMVSNHTSTSPITVIGPAMDVAATASETPLDIIIV